LAQAGVLFLLNPENEPFARGASPKLPAGGQGCILLFMSIFVLAGLFMTVEIARQWVHVAILSTSYAEVEGQVVDRWIESDDGATYYITYHFVTNDQVYAVEEAVAKATYDSAEEDQLLTVRYAQRDPSIATIEPGRIGGLLAITAFGLVWNGVVLPIYWLLVREIRKRRKLAREGQQIAGEIVRCSGDRDSDGDLTLQVRFGFRSPNTGAWIEGQDSQTRKEFLAVLAYMDKIHKREAPGPHWYLWALGVEPGHQGQGIGSRLIQPVLARADKDGVPCYLETQTEGNVAFYQKQGFEVVSDGWVPEQEIRVWTMLREPQR
jgi:ribosomal protein S18 acetylase RimI-like enzyme